jgi:hypothetical protein
MIARCKDDYAVSIVIHELQSTRHGPASFRRAILRDSLLFVAVSCENGESCSPCKELTRSKAFSALVGLLQLQFRTIKMWLLCG